MTYAHMQGACSLMRYMKHCHRREWLEAILSMIAADKLPGIVKLLDERHGRNEARIGGWHYFGGIKNLELKLGGAHPVIIPSPFPTDELQKELAEIISRAAEAGVASVDVAMTQFVDHTLRDKAAPGEEDWKVSVAQGGGWIQCQEPRIGFIESLLHLLPL